ncbi:aldo/keto reductase [Eggerthellaceae bacterium 3-80]|nr:aldo/keto reductase [bacterium D16-34]
MDYRTLGKTNLSVSEIGFGAEWIGKMPDQAIRDMMSYASLQGVNILDCWMSDPAIRDALGRGLAGVRDKWIIQGHVGSTWQNGQYVRTRNLDQAKPAFEDLLRRLNTDYIDLGMIHYVDEIEDFNAITTGPFMDYMRELKHTNTIGHIGLSTHDVAVAKQACMHPEIEMIMFSLNPCFDLAPAQTTLDELYASSRIEGRNNIDPDRAELYALAEHTNTGITVMKAYAGGRLLDAQASPFGVALTPTQCLHYALTRPGVASVLVGTESVEQIAEAIAYTTASAKERDYASVLAQAPHHAFASQCTYCGHCAPCSVQINIALVNKLYDLASLRPNENTGAQTHYTELTHKASECTRCKACEPRCPFGVAISDRMDEAASFFGC